MRGELALPAFQMDCRDWLIITPSETGLPDEVAGTPLLAVLSTVVLDAGSVSRLIAPSEGQQPVGRAPNASVKTRMDSSTCHVARAAPPG